MPINFEIARLVDGLNFGIGTISKDERVESAEDPLDHTIVDQLEAALEDPRLVVPISKDKTGEPVKDDGCGDGRPVARVFKGLNKILEKSLHRAKVFGGGLAMAVASTIGLGKAKGHDLQEQFAAGRGLLDEAGVDYGSHTDNHAHGDNCGCGAIDKAPAIIANSVTFKDQIATVVGVLTYGKHENEYLEAVQGEFAEYAEELPGQAYSGKKVSDDTMEEEKVVKELEGEHKETHIVLNTIPGTTVDQEFIRQQTDGHAQVFAVDEWRLREISQKLYKETEDQEKAYLSMLVYTLATAGTLTKGDLPVYVITKANEEATIDLVAA